MDTLAKIHAIMSHLVHLLVGLAQSRAKLSWGAKAQGSAAHKVSREPRFIERGPCVPRRASWLLKKSTPSCDSVSSVYVFKVTFQFLKYVIEKNKERKPQDSLSSE